jgi:hypothetical protein
MFSVYAFVKKCSMNSTPKFVMELVNEKLDVILLYNILFHINYNIMKC